MNLQNSKSLTTEVSSGHTRKSADAEKNVTSTATKTASHVDPYPSCERCSSIIKTAKDNMESNPELLVDVMTDLCHVLRVNHTEDAVMDHIQSYIATIVGNWDDSKEFPECLTCIPTKSIKYVLHKLIKEQKWQKIVSLLFAVKTHVLGQDYNFSYGNEKCLAAIQNQNVLKGGQCEVEKLGNCIPLAGYLEDFSGSEEDCHLELLLQFHADPNGSHKQKPLQVAAEKRMFWAVQLLLEYGADPQYFSLEEGDSPILAAHKVGPGQTGIKETLLQIHELFPTEYPQLDPRLIKYTELELLQQHVHKLISPLAEKRSSSQESQTVGSEQDNSVPITSASANVEDNIIDSEDEYDSKYFEKDKAYDNKHAASAADPEWDVVCTKEVQKVLDLKNKSIDSKMKEKCRAMIKSLARGEIYRNIYKWVKHTPKDIELYEAKINKEARILWEKTVAFSPRRSGATSDQRVYVQLIRIWAIVFDHDNLKRTIAMVVKSHKKGRESSSKKTVRSISDKSANVVNNQHPQLFTEVDSEQSFANDKTNDKTIYPLATAEKNRYAIRKFYPLSSEVLASIAQNQNVDIDFPFSVTEHEHEIINLRPKPPAPILLLGRSGTGKTTCCLYRMWTSFLGYWQDKDVSEADTPRTLEPGRGRTDAVKMDHLHQVFITKNSFLCKEVKRNFQAMSCGNSATAGRFEDNNSPHLGCLEKIKTESYPLFVNSKHFWLLLDASLPGEKFFERDKDGRLKHNVIGWDISHTYEEIGQFRSNDSGEDMRKGNVTENQHKEEVTYELFAEQFLGKWIKNTRKKITDYQPSLVWAEIMSFITGSTEAMENGNGYLDRQEYKTLGRKRAPNFNGERDVIYDLFEEYKELKRKWFYFDMGDLISNLHRRMKILTTEHKWIIDQMYVDETQDFTQAELILLMKCCHDPREMFLTGDTAQGITRGVSFRFEDLKSVIHNIVGPGTKLYTLTHNYRSHADNVELAGSIIELLNDFYPKSFDWLEPDKGLFKDEFHKPVLLSTCEFQELANALCGNQEHSLAIDFGANQAIIVVNDDAKRKLPEEFKQALTLTIQESKGLEFNDILIYNFFKDSQAKKEWRVVTDYLPTRRRPTDNASHTVPLVKINVDAKRTEKQLRPLEFDPEKHNILITELKMLYTALTRAKVNIWIYDEDEEARAPMFQYFEKLNLVNTVDHKDKRSFAEASTAEEWGKRGQYLKLRGLISQANDCFKMHKTMLAKRLVNDLDVRNNLLGCHSSLEEAALVFGECDMHVEAARCFAAAQLCEGQDHIGQTLTRVKEQLSGVVAQLDNNTNKALVHEALQEYNQSVEILMAESQTEDAVDVCERYCLLKQRYRCKPDLLEKAPAESVENLYLKAISSQHEAGNVKDMIVSLERFARDKHRIHMSVENDFVFVAVPLVKTGKFKILKCKLVDVQYYTKVDNTPQMKAELLLAIVRTDPYKTHNMDFIETKKCFTCTNCSSGLMETNILESYRLGNVDQTLLELKEKYVKPCDIANGIFLCDTLLSISTDLSIQHCITIGMVVRKLLEFISAFENENKTEAWRQKIRNICSSYGMFEQEDGTYKFMNRTPLGNLTCRSGNLTDPMEQEDVLQLMRENTIHSIRKLHIHVRQCLLRHKEKLRQKYDSRQAIHDDFSDNEKQQFLGNRVDIVSLLAFELCLSSKLQGKVNVYDGNNVADLCDELHNAIFPSKLQQWFLTENATRQLLRSLHLAEVGSIIEEHIKHIWSQMNNHNKRANTDELLKLFRFQCMTCSTTDTIGTLLAEIECQHTKCRRIELGLVQDRKTHISNARRLIEFVNNVYQRQNPLKGCDNMTEFLKYPISCLKAPLTPSITNVIMMLELQFVLAACIFLRHAETPDYVVIPACYTSVMHLWDGLCSFERSSNWTSMFDSVQHSRTPSKQEWDTFIGNVRAAVKLLCGSVDQNLTKVLRDNTGNTKAETMERVAVLTMVYLSNIDGERTLITGKQLKRALYKSLPMMTLATASGHAVRNAINQLKKFTTSTPRQEIVDLLSQLLVALDGGPLYKWTFRTSSCGVGEFLFEEIPRQILNDERTITGNKHKPEL